ncbi:Vps54-like protein-domain-containing protein [Bombardia bombarda]|uniref:Vps54-like protein-domain-containing protein n=1 Tax=Bombardia bombarda TaxID=252184 RepID=A0AA40C836_9PEZI|nr:Vps54-like protein-domain-containing protein [Bombardia bombarda]
MSPTAFTFAGLRFYYTAIRRCPMRSRGRLIGLSRPTLPLALGSAGDTISSLLQPPVVRTGLQPHTYAPTSSLHKTPTARDIIPEVQRLKNAGEESTNTPGIWPDNSSEGNAVPREHGGQLLSPQKGSSRAYHGPPQLSIVPDVYFDQDFHLENPRTFHVVIEKSEVVTPNSTTVAIQNGDGPAPRKALASNGILQEKLSWYMDTIEVHLIDSISTASTEFFSTLGSLRELHAEAAGSVEKIKAIRETLATLDKHLVGDGLALLQTRQIFSNLQQMNDAVLQLKHIVDGVARSESLVDEGEVEKALAEIDFIELLMAGERDETTGSAAAADIHLRDLRGAVALQGVVGDLTVLRSRIGKLFESKVHDILLRDLQRHIHSVSTPEVLLRWGAASQRAKGNHPREPSSFPAYMLMTDELRMALSPQISGLDRSRSISTAILAYRELVLREIRSVIRKPLPSSTDDAESVKSASTSNGGRIRTNQEKSSVLAANIRALDAVDAEKLLSDIFIGVTVTLRRLKTQSSVLLDLACTIGNSARFPTTKPLNGISDNQAPTFEIQEEMHVAFDLSNLLEQAVDVSLGKINTILRVRSEQTASLPLAYFLRYFTLNLFFVNECEAISGRAGTSLKNIVNDHIHTFIQTHGKEKSHALTQGMDVDSWQVKDFTTKNNIILQEILECSTSDPLAWADASRVWVPLSQGDTDEARAADKVTTEDTASGAIVDEETFLLPHSAILCLEGVSDFLRLLSGIPSRSLDIAMSLVSYIQLFDSRCRQLILGAGAVRSAGLKNITTAHLALAWQAVSFIATTIPYIREFVRRQGPTGQSSANLIGEFDKVRRGLQEHQDAIVQKIVDIIASRAGTLCKKALETEWSKESPKDVRKYMADLARDTSKLYKALSKYLPPQSVRQVMVLVFASYREQLGKALEKADLETETGRECMIRDVEHLAYKLDKFEGFSDLDAQLKQIIESKEI